MKILGIDPGIALVGYSILEVSEARPSLPPILLGCGVISTPSTDSVYLRLQSIRKDLLELLNTFKPDAAAVELIYFSKNVKTAITVAQARGVILESLASYGIKKITEFTPTHIKQVLFGSGQADKKQIQLIVSQTLNLPGIIKPDDAADATAIALSYIRGGFLHV
jgi:crossover junction endodeoxyribonuclease RuvC